MWPLAVLLGTMGCIVPRMTIGTLGRPAGTRHMPEVCGYDWSGPAEVGPRCRLRRSRLVPGADRDR